MSSFLTWASSFLWIGLALTAAAPGIIGGDAPELTSAAFHFGSAHAPGYPLFITLGHLFQLLPLGTPAFRLTFFSILIQAAAYIVLARTLKGLLKDSLTTGDKRILSVLTAGLVMAGPLVFHQVVSPEVFALHLFFVVLLLRFVLFPTPSHFFLASFISGVALSHQHLTFLILPALVWTYRGHFKNAKRLVWSFTLCFLGLTPYLVLPLRAVHAPLANWGNPTTFLQFLYHVTRTQYGGDITTGSLLNGCWDLFFYSKKFLSETYGLGPLLLLVGIWKNRQGFKAEYYIGGFCLFVLLPFLIRAAYDPENNFVNSAFLPPAILWFSPFFLKGLEWIYEKAVGLKPVLTAVLCIFLIILTGFSYTRNDASRNLAVEDVTQNMLLQMPSRSVIFSEGDAVTFPLAYLKLVLNLRPDVDAFDRTGGLFRDIYHLLDYRKIPGLTPAQQVSVERSYVGTRQPGAVFYTENTDAPGQPLTMTGLLFQVVGNGNPAPPEALLWNLFRVPRIELSHDYLSRETSARFYLFKASFDLDLQKNTPLGMDDLRRGKELAYDNSRVLLNAGVVENFHDASDQAALTFEKSSNLTPLYYLSWFDRGVVAEKQNQITQAVSFFRKAIQLNPDYVEAHQHLGFEYYQTKNFTEAVQEWETVRKLDPGYAGAYRNLGYMFMRRQPDYAVQMLQQYLGLTPNAPDRANLEKWLATQRH